MGISEATLYNWNRAAGAEEVRRFGSDRTPWAASIGRRESAVKEVSRLGGPADLSLDKHMLQEVLKKKL
jgi:hypothetical protein